MKLIFLDVDGVMNTVKDYFSTKLETEEHFKYLKEIVDKTGAKIVLSSSWRISKHLSNTIENRLKDFDMELYGRTPILSRSYVKRGEEIKLYLERLNEEVESFVILDDEADMCEYTETNLVQTDHYIGLRPPWTDQAIAILNKND